MKKIFIYILLFILTCILSFAVNTFDPDLWARLAVGSIFQQTGWILQNDIFAYTPVKSLWIDHEWGSGVIFYFLAKHLGWWGIILIKAALIFLIFLLVFKTIELQQNNKKDFEPLYFVLLAFSIFPGVASPVRCQLFTFLLFMLCLYILERVRRGENRLLWILPATMLLWANLHGGFIVGFGLVLVYAAGEFLNRNNFVKYLITLIITIPVTLINPYGIKYWSYIINAVTMPRPGINEWQPISLHEPSLMVLGIPVHIFAGFVLLVVFTLISGIKLLIQRSKPDWIKVLLFPVLIYLGFSHKRHAIFFALAAASLLYSNHIMLFGFLRELVSNRILLIKKIADYLVLLAACVLLIMMPKTLTVSPVHYPVGSIEFIRQNNLSGKVLTSYRWGNYVLWKLYPQCLVAIDGRYEEVYPDYVFDTVMNFTHHLNNKWDEAVKRFPPDIIIVPRKSYTYGELSRLKDWEIVYADAISFLLLPKNKVRSDYINPDFSNNIYHQADLSKPVNFAPF